MTTPGLVPKSPSPPWTMFLVTISRDSRSSGRTPRSSAPRVWPLAADQRLALEGEPDGLARPAGLAAWPAARAWPAACRRAAVITIWPFMPMMRPISCCAEAAHHRQHDDQGRHAQRHADQGEDGDEGDEALALARGEIAPGQPALDGGRRVTHGAVPPPDRAARRAPQDRARPAARRPTPCRR